MLAANEIKVDTNELVQILTLCKEDILRIENPFGNEESRPPQFTYPFFGEEQVINLTIPAGTDDSILESLEILLCIETSVSRSSNDFQGLNCFLGVNEETILSEARGMIEEKLQEMTREKIKFYHSWSEFKDHIKGYHCSDLDASLKFYDSRTMVKLPNTNNTNTANTDNTENLVQIYGRIQLLLPFFIEAATPINLNDSKWCIYLSGRELNQEIEGLMTAYRFFKYPEGSRIRISQVLIFPRFQGSKRAQALYSNVSSDLRGMEECVEICVEDATDKFERIRSAVDWRTAKQFSIWDDYESAKSDDGTKCDNNTLSTKCDDNTLSNQSTRSTVISRLMKELKLNQEQAERIYNLNCYMKLNTSTTTNTKSLTKKMKLTPSPPQISLRKQIKRWLLQKYRKELPESDRQEDRFGKLAELFEIEMDEFLVPLMGELTCGC